MPKKINAPQPSSSHHRFVQFSRDHRCFLLLASLVATLIFYPYLAHNDWRRLVLQALGVIVPLTAILGMSRRPMATAIGTLFFIPLIYIHLQRDVSAPFLQSPFDVIATLLFYLYSTVMITEYVIRASSSRADRIAGGIAVYILIGFCFSLIYLLFEFIEPGSLAFDSRTFSADNTLDWSDAVYFSFITLSTAGYGDVLPSHLTTRSIAIIETIVGVMYVAIFIARLTGHPLVGKRKPLGPSCDEP